MSHMYQGALQIAGLGRPDSAGMDAELDCFGGYTSQTLHEHIRDQVKDAISSPHYELINFAADGICVFAMTVRHMLAQGYSIQALRKPSESVFEQIRSFMGKNM